MNALNTQVQEEIAAAARQVPPTPPSAPSSCTGEEGLRRRVDIKEMAPLGYAKMATWRPRSRPRSTSSPTYPSRSSPPSPATRSAAGSSSRCAPIPALGGEREGGAAGRSCSASSRRRRHAAAAKAHRPARAKDLIFTGRHVAPPRRWRSGSPRVVPDADVYQAAVTWSRSTRTGPALALRPPSRR